MVQTTITYVIEAYNTGVMHDLTCGCSLLDPSTGQEIYALPWWVVWDVETNAGWNITIRVTGDVNPGTYLAVARAWENHSGGTKAGDLDSIGAVYDGGTGVLTGILDEATATLVVEDVAVVSAEIGLFTITV